MKSTRHILLVDDHSDTREFVSELLRTEGYVVVEAENGNVALELLLADATHEPLLIILDLEMPVMTGWEFLARVSDDRRLSRIPVLVTSGSTIHPEELRTSNIAGFLRKPYAVDHLLLKIAAIGSCASVEER